MRVVRAAPARKVVRGQQGRAGTLPGLAAVKLAVFQVQIDGGFGQQAVLGDDMKLRQTPLSGRQIVLDYIGQFFIEQIGKLRNIPGFAPHRLRHQLVGELRLRNSI